MVKFTQFYRHSQLRLSSIITNFRKSSFLKGSSIYILGSILNSGIPFILLPILTRYLTPSEYGLIAMFSIFISILNTFQGISIHGAIQRVYYENKFSFKVYVANSIYILFFNAVLFFILIWFMQDIISYLIKIPENWILLAVLMSFFQSIFLILLSIYQAKKEAKKYVFFQILLMSVNLLLSIIFVVFLFMHWEGRLLGWFISLTIVGLISLYILYKNWTILKINFYYIEHILKFCIPLIPHALGGMFIALTDRFIITNILGLKETGIYSVALQIGLVVGIIADSIHRAYVPWLFEKLNKNDINMKIKIVKFTYIYFIVIFLVALLFGFCIQFLLEVIIGNKFIEAKNIIIWIALGKAFNGMYYMVAIYISYAYKNGILSLLTISIGGFNIILTLSATYLFGLIGTAISYFITYLLMFLLSWLLSTKLYYMPWNIWKIKIDKEK